MSTPKFISNIKTSTDKIPAHMQLTIPLNISHIARNLINTIHTNEIQWTEEDAGTLEYLALLIKEKLKTGTRIV